MKITGHKTSSMFKRYADLGWLERLIPTKQTQAAIEGRVKGLLI